jgi:hypothetical protein
VARLHDESSGEEPPEVKGVIDANQRDLAAPRPTATTIGLESVAPKLESLAAKLGVKAVLVMRSDPDTMVVAATAGPATAHFGVGDAGPKAGSNAGYVPLYCERVVESRQSTFVRDSRADEVFAGNADEARGGLAQLRNDVEFILHQDGSALDT